MTRGFLIPETIDPGETACVVFKIPNDPLYRQAVRGHIWQLARWFEWEQTGAGDTRASEVATLFRTTLLDSLEITEDCNDAIESILPEGTIVVDLAELCEAVYCGNIRALEEAAQRMLLASDKTNVGNDVIIDKTTGAITVDTSSLGGSEVIPGTAPETYFGGVYNQAVQFKKMFEDMNSAIDDGYSNDTVNNLVSIFINPINVTAWTLLVTEYYTSDPEIIIDADSLALFLFCDGVQSGLLDYAIDEHGASESDLNAVVDFASLIPDNTWQKWLQAGQTTPKLGYEIAPCYRYPAQSFTVDSTSYVSGFSEWDTRGMVNRKVRVEIKVVAPLVDGDGDVFDGVYYLPAGINPVTTYKTRVIGSGQASSPNNPAYKASGGTYALEYSCNFVIKGHWFNSIPSFAPISGQLIITIYDLGAI